ncbi:capsid assembly scaffolding protein Gp46 family protein [Tuberibacillus calidus]|jgi:hypothetical protein|uniref:capsid assembly scaffolding protein Gp46 family protein n=1 Tax=Tuberibacillus calidus TaxID=340097 RepID=UPI000428B996|nr:DUF4355 domain-containing protein [Tuberibacillus calidus]
MTLEQLKQMLKNGEINQEQFDKKVKELGLDNQDDKKDKKGENGDFDISKLLESEEFKKVLEKAQQSAADKVRSEYSQKLKDIQSKYDELKNEKLTDEEKFQLEKQKYEEEKRAFEKQKLDFEFTKHLANEKLPIELNDFVPGSDIEKKKENLKTLMEIIDGFVQEKVKAKFREQGRDVETGKKDSKTLTKEDFQKMSIDEKIALAESDYETYKRLATV